MPRDNWARSGYDLLDKGRLVGTTLEQVRRAVLALEPVDTAQHWLRDQALATSGVLLKARWELLERQDLPIRSAFLIVLTSWITFIFVSFGLNALRNAVVVGTFAVCSYAVGAAVFSLLEMKEPFDGLIQAAKHPMEIALARMGR